MKPYIKIKRPTRLFISLILATLAFSLSTDQQGAFDKGKQEAMGALGMPDQLDFHDYCSGSDCDSIEHPDEGNNYNNEGRLDQEVDNAVSQGGANDIIQNYFERPHSSISDNDPTYNQAKHAIVNAYSITHQDKLFCLDGECHPDISQDNDHFAESAAGMAGVGSGGNQFDPDTMQTFGGTTRRCKKAKWGFSDCCKLDSGWGGDLGLARCSEDEKALAAAKKKKLTHYVGTYCSSHVPLVGCTAHKESHCEFTNKLSRIVNEQGRPQIGIGWGSAKHPRCEGMTPDEISHIDFDAIDFSEFYGDIEDQINEGAPNPDDIQDGLDPNHDNEGNVIGRSAPKKTKEQLLKEHYQSWED